MQRRHAILTVSAVVLLLGGVLLTVVTWSPAATPGAGSSGAGAQQGAGTSAAAIEPATPIADRTEATAAGAPSALGGAALVEVSGRVVDGRQRPLPEARVWVVFGSMTGVAPTEAQPSGEPVTTDAEGRFLCTGTSASALHLTVTVTHPSHAPTVRTFAREAPTSAIALGDIALASGGRIRGRVTDLEGNGIPSAVVRLEAARGNALRDAMEVDALLPAVRTDPSGSYALDHVPAGKWSVTAVADSYSEGRARPFVLDDEAVVPDIQLGAGFALSGVVRDLRGLPIEGAALSVKPETVREGLAVGRAYEVSSDAEGRFELPHLPGVAMRLEVRADGYLDLGRSGVDPKARQPLDLTLQDGLRLDGRVVDAAGRPVTRYALRVDRKRGVGEGGSPRSASEALLARLRAAAENGGTEDLVRARIEALRQKTGEPDVGRPVADLGEPEPREDGAFSVTGLQEGIYEVLLESPDHARFRSAEVTLRVAAAAPPMEITLEAGAPLRGVVSDTRGEAVRGARIVVTSIGEPGAAGPETQPQPDALVCAEALAGADGAFAIEHVPLCRLRVRAEVQGYAPAEVECPAGQGLREVELRLDALGALAGSVSRTGTGETLPARVYAVAATDPAAGGSESPLPKIHTVVVRGDGSYRISDLPVGPYVVRCWEGSAKDLTRALAMRLLDPSLQADVQVVGGDTTTRDLDAEPLPFGGVAGVLVNNGAPAARYRIALKPASTTAEPSGPKVRTRIPRGAAPVGLDGPLAAKTDRTGKFSIEQVPAGRYQLRVLSERGALVHEQEVVVQLGEVADAPIQLTTVRLKGRVLPRAGEDASILNGSVALLRGITEVPDNLAAYVGEHGSVAVSVRRGEFRFDDLKPGQYLMLVTMRKRARASKVVVVTGDADVEILSGEPNRFAAPDGARTGRSGGR